MAVNSAASSPARAISMDKSQVLKG